MVKVENCIDAGKLRMKPEVSMPSLSTLHKAAATADLHASSHTASHSKQQRTAAQLPGTPAAFLRWHA
jgi:hypothetical protein